MNKKKCKFVKLDSNNSKRALAARSYRKTETYRALPYPLPFSGIAA